MLGKAINDTVLPKSEIKALTGLRIVAAAWVFLHHFADVIFGLVPGLAILAPLASQGWRGVDLFFMLSGFILSLQYLNRFGPGVKRAEYVRFLRLRIARVYPVHFLTLHTAVILFTGAAILGVPMREGLSENTLWTYVQNLFLVQAWFPQGLSWSGVSWSVSAEWFAYLLFPVAAVALFRIRSTALAWAIAGASLVLFTMLYQAVAPTDGTVRTDGDLLRIAASFIAGCCLYKVYTLTGGLRSHSWSWGAPLAVAAILIVTYLPKDLLGDVSVLMLPAFGFLVLGLAKGTDLVSRSLSTRVMVHGGHISYSFYMVHQQILTVVRSLVPESWYGGGDWGLGVITVVLTFFFVYLAAHLVYRLVEEPSRRLIRGQSSSSNRQTSEAAINPA